MDIEDLLIFGIIEENMDSILKLIDINMNVRVPILSSLFLMFDDYNF